MTERLCSEWAVLADENGMYLSQPYDRGDDAISPVAARKLATQLIAMANRLEPIVEDDRDYYGKPFRCDRADCDGHIVRPGKEDCHAENCEYHKRYGKE